MTNKHKHHKYRSGFKPPVAADVVAEELTQIWNEHGGKLKPDDVVQVASDPDSPLHPAFEWDDSVAAHKHRLRQARDLIRSVRVIDPEAKTDLPAWVSVVVPAEDEKPSRHYQSVEALPGLPDEYASALLLLKRKLLELTQSFEEIKALAQKRGVPNGELQRLVAITEALATARSLSEHLQ